MCVIASEAKQSLRVRYLERLLRRKRRAPRNDVFGNARPLPDTLIQMAGLANGVNLGIGDELDEVALGGTVAAVAIDARRGFGAERLLPGRQVKMPVVVQISSLKQVVVTLDTVRVG